MKFVIFSSDSYRIYLCICYIFVHLCVVDGNWICICIYKYIGQSFVIFVIPFFLTFLPVLYLSFDSVLTNFQISLKLKLSVDIGQAYCLLIWLVDHRYIVILVGDESSSSICIVVQFLCSSVILLGDESKFMCCSSFIFF